MTAPEFRALLKASGLTQRALAARLGLNPMTVNRWAKGNLPVPKYASAYLNLFVCIHPTDTITAGEYFEAMALDTYTRAIDASLAELKSGGKPADTWAPAKHLIEIICSALALQRSLGMSVGKQEEACSLADAGQRYGH